VSLSITQKNITQVVFYQFVLLAVAAIATMLIKDKWTGFSLLLGGLAAWIPTCLFAWSMFAFRHSAKTFLVIFLVGETLRLFISAAFFVLIMVYLPAHLLPVFIGFAGTIIAFWPASFMLLAEEKKVKLP